jgi:hypothetical protein
MRKLIRRGIRRYFQETSLHYHQGLENELVKFFCVFETKKDFFHSQHTNEIFDLEVDMGLHFHLFISGRNGDEEPVKPVFFDIDTLRLEILYFSNGKI